MFGYREIKAHLVSTNSQIVSELPKLPQAYHTIQITHKLTSIPKHIDAQFISIKSAP